MDFGIIYFDCTVKDLLTNLKNNQRRSLSFQPPFSLSAIEKKKAENVDSKIKIISLFDFPAALKNTAIIFSFSISTILIFKYYFINAGAYVFYGVFFVPAIVTD